MIADSVWRGVPPYVTIERSPTGPESIVPPSRAAALSLLLSLLVVSAPARGASSERVTFYARLSGGASDPSLSSLNAFLHTVNDSFVTNGWTASSATFRGLGEWGGEVGVRVGAHGTFGIVVGVGHGAIRNRHAQPYVSPSGNPETTFRTFEQTLDFTTVEGVAAAEARRGLLRLEGGLTIGAGFSSLDESVIYEDTGRNGPPIATEGTFTGSALVSSLFVGARWPLAAGLEVYARGGYRLANLGEMRGKYRGDISDVSYPPASVYQSLAPPPFNFDFSGPFARAGLGWSWAL
jgi:hypothetical protein